MPPNYFQKHTRNKSRLSDSLNGQRWRFLKRGSENFQEGFPSPHDSKPQNRTSRFFPALQARKDLIVQVEYCLSQHPLALYPHLEESVPPKLFKEVLSILDPEMLPVREEAGDADVEEDLCVSSATQSQLRVKGKEHAKATLFSCKDPKGKNPYTWFSKQEVAAREREARLNYIPPLEENVIQATKEFCCWLESLGGEKYNIDEATIISLFDVSYKTKLPLSVPIHVTELDHLPAELRTVSLSPPQASKENISPQGGCCKETWEKIKYGAWYLDPKTWTKQKGNEPLVDPKSEDTRSKNSRRVLDEKDAEFMQLYGTRAFKEFLDRRGYRIPEFLQKMFVFQEAPGPKAVFRDARNEFQ